MKLFDLFKNDKNQNNSDNTNNIINSNPVNEDGTFDKESTQDDFIELKNQDLDNMDIVSKHKLLKKSLLKQLHSLNDLYEESGHKNDRLTDIINKLENNNFQIVVLGEFSRGKSTFINALLNENILPSSILPTTAVLTKIFYGKERKVKINFNDNTSKSIELSELKQYITSLENEELSNKITDAEIYYPTEFCKNGCSIIDTPGVNDINQQKVDITYNYIPQSDAAIILLDPDQPFTESEKEFIENKIIDNKIEKLFFVLNKFDLIEPAYVEETVKHVKDRIFSLKKINSSNVNLYCLSSKEALRARIKNEDNDYNFEFRKFEDGLMEFLINEKGDYILLNAIEKGKLEKTKLEEALLAYTHSLKISMEQLVEKKAEFDRIKDTTNRVCNEVKSQLDFDYKNFQSDIDFKVDIELSSIFDYIYGQISAMTVNKNNYGEAIPKIFESRIEAFVKNSLYPEIVNSLGEINTKLSTVLYDHKKIINQFSCSLSESVTETALQIVKDKMPTNIFNNEGVLYIPERTSTRDIAPTIVYAGGAISAGLLVAAMVTGPVGLLLAVIAGGAVFKTLDDNRIQRDKNFVYSWLGETKCSVTIKAKSIINKIVRDEYLKIQTSIYNEIQDNINLYDKIFDDLIKERKSKAKEFNEKEEFINKSLCDISNIQNTFDDITTTIRG